ncbi:MAG: hypothetical protein KDA05_03095 [Phycisphaerales bacterium]|nr:hypothetical protein [Phycisphaerales bacterium]
MKLPLVRIGITLAVGSVLASLVVFYLAIGEAVGSADAEDPPAGLEGAMGWFVREFLFQGSIPTVLFWLGVAATLVGVVRMAIAPPAARRTRRSA